MNVLPRRKKIFPWLKSKDDGIKLLARLTKTFEESASFDAALSAFSAWMADYLDTAGNGIYLWQAGDNRFALFASSGNNALFLRYPHLLLDEFSQCGLSMLEFSTFELPAAAHLANAHPMLRACLEAGMASLAGLPLWAHGRLHGMTLLLSARHHHSDDDERAFFRVAAQHVRFAAETSLMIERFEQEAAVKIAQLQESEEKYRVLFEDANDVIFSLDFDTQRIVECNRQAERLLGYTKEELLAMTVKDFWQQADEQRLVQQLLQSLKERRSAKFQERQVRRKDGALVWVEINASIIEYRGKQAIFANLRDVTPRKSAEAEREAIDAVNNALLSGQPIEEVYRAVSRAAAMMFAFDRMDLLLHGNMPRTIRIFFTAQAEKVTFSLTDREVSLAGSPLEQIIRLGKPEIVEYPADAHPHLFAMIDGRLAESLFFPLLFKEQVIGMLHFGRYARDRFAASCMDFLHRIAPQIAMTIDNMLLFHAVSEEKAVYKHLIENVNEVVFQADPKGTILFVNHRIQDILGYTPEEMTGANFFSCVIPEDLEEAKAAFRLTLRREQPLSGEFRVFHKQGAMLTISIYTRPIFEDGRTVGMQGIIQDITPPAARFAAPREGLHEMVGRSPKMQEIYDLIVSVAQTDSTVLIHGESGTGKELIAQAIHAYSHRQNKPFIVVNCAAYSEHLLESELFGHERGAFTGAHRRKLGRFELAKGGTLFLDEIGEISPHSQILLLRVLQNKTFERVGGEKTLESDVRIVAATNKNLETEMNAKRFREDLFYRLNVIMIEVPPLRQRKEDIPDLIEHFRKKYSKSTGKQVLKCSQSAMELLMRYDWFGNVRELENTIERAVVMASGATILPEDLPAKLRQGVVVIPEEPSAKANPAASLYEHERDLILKTLQATKWNKYQTAKLLGITRSTLYSKIQKYELDK